MRVAPTRPAAASFPNSIHLTRVSPATQTEQVKVSHASQARVRDAASGELRGPRERRDPGGTCLTLPRPSQIPAPRAPKRAPPGPRAALVAAPRTPARPLPLVQRGVPGLLPSPARRRRGSASQPLTALHSPQRYLLRSSSPACGAWPDWVGVGPGREPARAAN